MLRFPQMQESVFEIMERTRFVDRLLAVVAVVVPFLIAFFVYLFRNRAFVANQRHHWTTAFFAAPAILLLWKLYNRITDRFGLDSVAGFFVNAALFLVVAVGFAVLNWMLALLLAPEPGPEASGAPPDADLPASTAD